MRITAAALLLAILPACDQISSADGGGDRDGRTVTRPGSISFYDQPERVTVPDTVTAGVPFTVEVDTYGGGCASEGETRVEVTELATRVSVFDQDFIPRDGACTDPLLTFTHQATVRFSRAGTATLQVRGRREPGNAAHTAERRIVVRPAP